VKFYSPNIVDSVIIKNINSGLSITQNSQNYDSLFFSIVTKARNESKISDEAFFILNDFAQNIQYVDDAYELTEYCDAVINAVQTSSSLNDYNKNVLLAILSVGKYSAILNYTNR
jgi:hypothetical protein